MIRLLESSQMPRFTLAKTSALSKKLGNGDIGYYDKWCRYTEFEIDGNPIILITSSYGDDSDFVDDDADSLAHSQPPYNPQEFDDHGYPIHNYLDVYSTMENPPKFDNNIRYILSSPDQFNRKGGEIYNALQKIDGTLTYKKMMDALVTVPDAWKIWYYE